MRKELVGHNIVVLDTETLRSADECRICGSYPSDYAHKCQPWGWNNKTALGLSIGCAYHYNDDRYEFFDSYTLEGFVTRCVGGKPLLVSFNGLTHDFVLMRGLLRQAADEAAQDELVYLHALCDAFKALCAQGYDLLAAIWALDPGRKLESGLNSLDAICQANGLLAKEMDGAKAPRLWQQGRYAEVIQYCMNDVVRTRALFEMVCAGQPILRGDGRPITLPLPTQFSLAQ